MSSMTLKHTVSPSGKTHRLTDPKSGQFVQLQYQSKPQFTDQVQGDLIRKFSREIFPVVIGQLPYSIDAELMDKGQKTPSLDYLHGYLAGLDAAEGYSAAERRREAERTLDRIARLEDAHNSILGVIQGRGSGDGGPVQGGPPPAAGAASVQMNVVEPPRVNRLDEGVRRVREAERNGW